MCGIVAEWNSQGVEPGRFARALTALRHRGPDGQGTWLSPDRTLALGHTRLAVIHPEGSPQPVISEDRQVVLVVNGEFPHRPQLPPELSRPGHRLAPHRPS